MNTKSISTYTFMFLMVGLLVISGCSDLELGIDNSEDRLAVEQTERYGKEFGQLFKPFRAKFFTTGGIQPGDESVAKCGDPPLFYNVQEGYGEATHLGRFFIRITFCVDASELLDDGMLSEGESIPYYSNENTEGYFASANGDRLFIFITAGEIRPTNEPGYVFEFNDPFEFSGGTGRFEEVSGTGLTQSLVMQVPSERTEHVWEGSLIFSQ
ncbi:MAG: hypothetical protein R3222_06095 [Balneolaceae bacterium]|nr:hypothetical protein [Balneolaceae bacterium]